MPCYSHHPNVRRTRHCQKSHVTSSMGQVQSTSTVESHEALRSTGGASAAGGARDCGRSDAIAAVMQVRPLSVVSGIAGWSPFGRPPFGGSRWL